MPEITLLNFGHPLNPKQTMEIEQIVGQKLGRIIQVMPQLDNQRPFQTQIEQLVDSIGLSPVEFQTLPYLVNLPGLAIAATILLAILHGRSGYLPPVLRLKPLKNTVPSEFVVAEVINLQAIRDKARHEHR